MKDRIKRIKQGIKRRWEHQKGNRRWQSLTAEIKKSVKTDPNQRPVILFNASTRLQSMSQNAAYSMLTAMSLRMQGVPVVQFACRSGLSRCVLGSNRDDFSKTPPCALCMKQSLAVFKNIDTVWFERSDDPVVAAEIENLSIDQLQKYQYQGEPLGFWAANSLRWFMRRHHLKDSDLNRQFFKAFILSGWNVYQQFNKLVDKTNPQAVVLFNGMFYPEAAARQVCLEKGIRVITHEVGLRPFTAFFTTGEATAYPMKIDDGFQLTPQMNDILDEYLSSRFKGNFSMAGIRFWPEMNGLDNAILTRISQFKKLVPVFTNVIFDTSQVHANTIFPHMFAWLDNVQKTAQEHPDVLFVIRAHPDECRPGKESLESVAGWVKESGISELPNVILIDANQYISSYELIRRAHLVMVYNSTIGLEATLLGKPVLAGGKARFTQLATAFYPSSIEDYHAQLKQMLDAEEIPVPPEFIHNARRFLYFQLYATSLDFSHFLKEDLFWKGYVIPRSFAIDDLRPEKSMTIKTLIDGILHEGDFYYPL